MKRGTLLLAALMIAMSGSPLAAQSRIIPFIGGGLAMGTGDLANETGNGWMVFGGLDMPYPSIPGLTIGATGSFSEIPYQGGFGEAMQVTAAHGELGYLFGSEAAGTVKPFLRAGLGLQVHTYDPGTIDTRRTSDTRIGGTASAGIQIRMGGGNLFVGGRFTSGTDGGYVGFTGGLSFPWAG